MLTHEPAQEQLRRSEERWHTLLTHMQELVLVLDEDGEVAFSSPAVSALLGYRADELCGRELPALVHPEETAALVEALQQAPQAPSVTLRHRLQIRDGGWRWLESTFVSLEDHPPSEAVMVVSHDITETVNLEKERERLEMERRVSHRLEAVGQLAAGIAHEINTPLQFVGDSVSFLGEAVDELLTLTDQYRDALFVDRPLSKEERRRSMREAEEQADLEYLLERIPPAFKRTAAGIERVRSIVMAMKRFSHTSTTDAAPADINEAVESTLAVCCNEYKYVAEVEFDAGELPPVTCNIGEINQVLLNLIINASQAIDEDRTRRGQTELGHISVRTLAAVGEVIISISDDGPGIPLELQDRIYEPFFTTKEVGKGTGQGLALARTAIERHGGRLECRSQPGAGTTFIMRLPVAADKGGERR